MKDIELAKEDVVRYIVKRFGLRMNKKLGQNFLISPDVVHQIARAADLKDGDSVLEIGPGIGSLTQALAETGAFVHAVELDVHLLPVLAKTLAHYDNVEIIHGDILKISILDIVKKTPFTVCANLPYYITTPIIMQLLESRLPIKRMIFMVQKEVAQRMVAVPGNKIYGALSVAVQYYTEPQLLFDISPHSFLPAPEVTSSVVELQIRNKPIVEVSDEKRFFAVVKAAFAQRRKTLMNALKGAGYDKNVIMHVLEQVNIDGNRRGETLNLSEFAQIANHISLLK
ncbi:MULTISPECIES: 16S rRNA (adenine(1518)-N(6)/adenine(1519)-N(6))-dimethyltransferase RsmA [Megasphaera]|jgi:hypothetical protein|uniref:Ribosomal RNA small subunit methyltransferase A n=1 Tax=Megasphaera hutchinsoni TaxID=1588748 RepID=A0A2J8BCQ0_9FIRM|nr:MULTISPECIES: 16S rRNA (adenine(1518)-N(6)/adenine(1519)-N(6))-dimethyltransferase RsmA [Megasphaera]EGS32649.1 dimethyladenosine transferase [Megasphaera sp. UPII 135-E]MUP48729.1 16S rRNA (adenine(1518)-N(6)/adenine(1519)-N(6))-dimethyltransferase RsmA [Veillonellaceae bacterium M2-8]MUP59246.1 16S rRNA (adenine(1518)-N(6)/adenine(1519)-N(6))-dimethyltransferase RsmA [Veillonellaceae bacterium M2-4]PNH22526.1 16S rRNA (adenine(1518)-N(6)/adenine(1519)-N(6))-dimethyltransferase [Megasphaera